VLSDALMWVGQGVPQTANAPECRGEPLPAARRPVAADVQSFIPLARLVSLEKANSGSVIAKVGNLAGQ
jgi:hypothetical protein